LFCIHLIVGRLEVKAVEVPVEVLASPRLGVQLVALLDMHHHQQEAAQSL
jgi:hypothetical protein